MKVRFKVNDLPPKKDGANSMWRKQPAVDRLIALRLSAARALGSQLPLREGISLTCTINVPSAARTLGDLDNVVSGILDGLQLAHALTPWQQQPRWSEPQHAHVRPDTWSAITDDFAVERIVANRRIVPTGSPGYSIILTSDDVSTTPTASWMREALEELQREVMALRKGTRHWVAVCNANPSRWFGGSRELHGVSAYALLRSLLMSLRRVTDLGGGEDVTLRNVLWKLAKLAAGTPEEAGYRAGAIAAKALRFDPDVEHLRQIADKAIAHVNPAGLRGAGGKVAGLAPENLNAATLAAAVEKVSDIYFNSVASQLARDGTYIGDDPFFKRVVNKGLPVVDYAPPDTYRGHGDEDTSRRYVSIEEQTWEAIVAGLPKPWPAAVIDEDARIRWWDGDEHDFDISAFASRWGVSEEQVHQILSSSAQAVLGMSMESPT